MVGITFRFSGVVQFGLLGLGEDAAEGLQDAAHLQTAAQSTGPGPGCVLSSPVVFSRRGFSMIWRILGAEP